MTLAVFKRVGKLPVVNERLNKLESWSEISFLSSFNTLVGIIYGPVALLISRDKRIFFCWCEKKRIMVFVCKVISIIFMSIFYFSLGFFANSTEIIVIYLQFFLDYL